MKELFIKYKAIILYLFFGGCTTLINIATYYIFAYILNMSTAISTFFAWFFAVVTAYITNKIWVFECKSWKREVLVKEIVSFFACRIVTGFLDIALMLIFVDILLCNDLIIKVVSNIAVIILNYLASKLVIFKNKQRSK